MTRKLFAKVVSVTLTASILFSLAVGCGKKDDSNSASEGQSGGQISELTFPISKDPITIKILKPLVMYDTEYSKMPVLQDFEKKSNIHVEWNNPAASDFTNKYNLIMSSGELPDAIIAMPADDIEKYGQQGALITLNDILEKNMPNLKKVLTQYPDAKKIITGTGGKIYSTPFVYRDSWGNNVQIIREDWLKKLNLQTPVTTDDWYKVLKAFKENDPNGNGKQDEIPFSGDGISDLRAFAMAWGVHDDSSNDFYAAEKLHPKDEKVHYTPIEPRYKEALEFMNKLYKEGLVDPEIVTNDSKAFQAKMTQDIVGATRGVFGGDLITMNTTAQKNGMTNFHLIVAPVVKGPYGDQFNTYPDPAALPQGFAITKSNKYPVETAKWADYWYSEEGQKSMMGVEGKSYTITNGEQLFTDWVLKNPDGKTVDEAWGSLTPGRSIWPTVWLPSSAVLQRDSEEVRYAKKDLLKPDLLAEPLPSRMSFSQVDNDKRKRLMTDIQTYVDESIVNFIVGKQPISDWDKFVAKVKSMGIDDVLNIYQKAYDDWKSK